MCTKRGITQDVVLMYVCMHVLRYLNVQCRQKHITWVQATIQSACSLLYMHVCVCVCVHVFKIFLVTLATTKPKISFIVHDDFMEFTWQWSLAVARELKMMWPAQRLCFGPHPWLQNTRITFFFLHIYIHVLRVVLGGAVWKTCLIRCVCMYTYIYMLGVCARRFVLRLHDEALLFFCFLSIHTCRQDGEYRWRCMHAAICVMNQAVSLRSHSKGSASDRCYVDSGHTRHTDVPVHLVLRQLCCAGGHL